MTNKHGRQESTDVVGWQQDEDPYASDSFVQIPSSNTKKSYPNQQREQKTPTQSNFVNGPITVNLSPTTTNVDFEDIYVSTTSFHSASDSPRQDHPKALPNPFSAPGEQPSHPESSQSLPQPPPPSYITELR